MNKQSFSTNKQKQSYSTQKEPRQIKPCLFCSQHLTPSYTDSVTLRRFMSTRAKIVPHLRSGICSKHQRVLTREIKRARHLALLPFTSSI